MLDDGGEQLDHLEVLETREGHGRARQQEVSTQDRQLVAEHLVDRGGASPRRSLVDHVIVEETGRVNHLGDLREAALLRGHQLRLTRPPLRVQSIRDGKHHHRTNLLATIHLKEVLCTRLEHWMVRSKKVFDAARQSTHVALY